MKSSELSPEVQHLLDLANSIAPPDIQETHDATWQEELSKASAKTLVGLTSVLSSGHGKSSRLRKALREAALAEIEHKNADAIIETLISLDNATNALNRRMFWLSVAGIVLASAQVAAAVVTLLAYAQ